MGFWIIEAANLDEALEWTRKAPLQEAAIEVRPLVEEQGEENEKFSGEKLLSARQGPDALSAPRRLTAEDRDSVVGRTFREESGRAVATLIRVLGDFDAAEEAVQEAFVTALERWPRDGVPANPGAWITRVARNRAIDRLRRDRTLVEKKAILEGLESLRPPAGEPELDEEEGGTEIEDDRLRLIFTCCHPALAIEARVALTLRSLGGLETAEIARAFLVSETTMAQRLVRAKRKIAGAGIPYEVPAAEQMPERLTGVLATLYLIFNEGYLGSSSERRSSGSSSAPRRSGSAASSTRSSPTSPRCRGCWR